APKNTAQNSHAKNPHHAKVTAPKTRRAAEANKRASFGYLTAACDGGRSSTTVCRQMSDGSLPPSPPAEKATARCRRGSIVVAVGGRAATLRQPCPSPRR